MSQEFSKLQFESKFAFLWLFRTSIEVSFKDSGAYFLSNFVSSSAELFGDLIVFALWDSLST